MKRILFLARLMSNGHLFCFWAVTSELGVRALAALPAPRVKGLPADGRALLAAMAPMGFWWKVIVPSSLWLPWTRPLSLAPGERAF